MTENLENTNKPNEITVTMRDGKFFDQDGNPVVVSQFNAVEFAACSAVVNRGPNSEYISRGAVEDLGVVSFGSDNPVSLQAWRDAQTSEEKMSQWQAAWAAKMAAK